MNSKERCLNAVAGRPVDRVPVFPLLMFFAADRAKITYHDFATNSHAMAEAQEHIFANFSIDAVTSCSDAFRISADLGGEMAYPEEKPPYLTNALIKTADDLKKLSRPDPTQKGSRMVDRVNATGEMVRTLGDDCLVLGWVDMPFAEACSVCGLTEFMTLLYDDSALAHKILEFLTDIVIDFAAAQLDVGVPMIGAGDAAASLISSELFREFVLPYEKRVCEAIHQRNGLVKLHICGNTTQLLGDMLETDADLFNVDHLVAFDTACDAYGKADKCFKGNLDPVGDIMHETPESCQAKALECIHRASGKKYMLSGGCEIPCGVSDEVFIAFCESPQIAAELNSEE